MHFLLILSFLNTKALEDETFVFFTCGEQLQRYRIEVKTLMTIQMFTDLTFNFPQNVHLQVTSVIAFVIGSHHEQLFFWFSNMCVCV